LAQLGQCLFQPRTFDLRTAEFVRENALATCLWDIPTKVRKSPRNHRP
jgi:hypothetical protein